MGQSATAATVFSEELDLIKTKSTRDFVHTVFDRLGHDPFWQRACSLSGKYHPLISQNFPNLPGGLVRHVKYGVRWGVELCRAHIGTGRGKYSAAEQNLADVVIAALILHDLLKDGDPELSHLPERCGFAGKSLITGCHGVDLANAIWERVLGRQGTAEQVLICYGIAGHMGVWTTPAEFRPDRIENEMARLVAYLVSTSDYCASRQMDIYLLDVMHQMGMVDQSTWGRIQQIQSARPAA